MTTNRVLSARRILVVDDEYLIAAAIAQTLGDTGAEVAIAATIAEATRYAQANDLSAAFLDVRLVRGDVEPVADLLAGQGVPFAFYTGEALPQVLRDKYGDVRVIRKPVQHAALVRVLQEVIASGSPDQD